MYVSSFLQPFLFSGDPNATTKFRHLDCCQFLGFRLVKKKIKFSKFNYQELVITDDHKSIAGACTLKHVALEIKYF